MTTRGSGARISKVMRQVFGVSELRPGQRLGETVEWSQCGTCDNCRGLAVRSEAVAVGAA